MRFLIACLLLFGCEVDFSKPKAPDPALAQRIAQKKGDLLRNPDDVKTRLDLGDLQLEAGQLFEAADNFAAARNAGSNDIRINAGLTGAYFELGYLKTGIDELKACFDKDRSNADCMFAYGKLIEADGRAQQELRQVWVRFLQVAPNHRKANYVRSSLEQLEAQLGAQPPPEAEPADPPPSAEAPVPGHPSGTPEPDEEVGELNEFGMALAKAFEFIKKNDAVGAENSFRKALELRPDDPGAMAGLAETLFAQNKQEDAVKVIEKAYALDPKDVQVRFAFGIIMIRNQRRVPEAIAAWEAMIAENPEYAERLGIRKRLDAIKKMQPSTAEPAPEKKP